MSPENVYFLNALPLTKEKFFENPATSDFILLFKSGNKHLSLELSYKSYFEEIVRPYQMLRDFFSNHGFHFIENITLVKFEEILTRDDQKLVIYLSHCRDGGTPNEAIEFADGLISSENLLNLIPPGYEKIIDFSVCNPQHFASLIQSSRTSMVLRYTAKKIKIIYWMIFYTELLTEMIRNNGNYFSAYKRALYTMLDIK